MTINHANPLPSGFTLIALPGKGEPIGTRVHKGTKDDPFLKVILKCPREGVETQAEIHDLWRFTLNDQAEQQLINAWAKLAYGVTGPKLVNVMQKRYPDMTNQIEFILLKIL